ncbi:CYTH domain-containing protein [Shewanella avicenniae]|uniref:CYTH domain-containing protein n=1 Tax=Shewanella avicenniae TaxID=2814294 RepID=A0ABX7QNG0_9GAMM|nr:CYTH domain-containing protein [Shewanella avicenniae]QSX33002.1 CYTH domain-containing protein [Shewanella avicenniae]
MSNNAQPQEIELKLLLAPESISALKTTVNQLANVEAGQQKTLVNRYFDTPSLALRQLDMGLRVRGCNGALEQTIKTAGKVVGGLHSRPEYNVDINSEEPTLALFPAEIWPEGTDVAALQQQLRCIFSTDFVRTIWLIQRADAEVEVAFDQGTVAANGKQEPICELEFELFSGDANALLTLAKQVAAVVPVRLGKASKAQRGYRLSGQQQAKQPTQPVLTNMNLTEWLSAWQLLEEAIYCFGDDCELAQQYWQWLAELQAALPRVLGERALDEAISGLALWIIGETQTASSLAPAQKLTALQHDVRYGQLQLQLLAILMAQAA